MGAASILYTLALVRGMNQSTKESIALMGPGRITIEAKRNFTSRGLSPGLTIEDAEAVRRAIPELYMAYPRARARGAQLRYAGFRTEDVAIEGVTEQWARRDWVYRLRGRFLSGWDVRNAARVCVIVEPGGWVKKPFWAQLWFKESAFDAFAARHDFLGKTVRLGDHLFTVVGVLKEPPLDQDPRWFSWDNPDVLVPVTTLSALLQSGRSRRPREVQEIRIDTGTEDDVASVKRRIEALLNARHRGEKDFEITDMRERIESQLERTRSYVFVATILGFIAMLAGGIGIMNVTLATIFSRIKEIGIRRAVGASRQDIMGQFISEAVLLGVAGGLAGVGLGLGALAYLRKHGPDENVSQLAWHHCGAVILLAAALCGLFSVYPALKAARLNPVDALRSE